MFPFGVEFPRSQTQGEHVTKWKFMYRVGLLVSVGISMLHIREPKKQFQTPNDILGRILFVERVRNLESWTFAFWNLDPWPFYRKVYVPTIYLSQIKRSFELKPTLYVALSIVSSFKDHPIRDGLSRLGSSSDKQSWLSRAGIFTPCIRRCERPPHAKNVCSRTANLGRLLAPYSMLGRSTASILAPHYCLWQG